MPAPSCALHLRLTTATRLTLTALLVLVGQDAVASHRYQYLSPMPEAALVSPENNVIIRYGPKLDTSSIAAMRLRVSGSRSGITHGHLSLADDGRTLLYTPEIPFALGERVTVDLAAGMATTDGEDIPPLHFSFTIAACHPAEQQRQRQQGLVGELERLQENATRTGSAPARPRRVLATACGTLEFPSNVVQISGNPTPGRIFTAPFSGNPNEGHLLILDDNGQPLFYRFLPHQALDFKMQPDGTLTYGTRQGKYFYALDSCYAVVDSFATGNGYRTDFHELQILDNGHALLMAYDPQPVGMDTVVVGGDPDATVIGLIIQEIDAAKNVVFQWRSWDHFAITDAAVSGNVDLLSDVIDYVHGNAIELDNDGNILISARHMNEITKIDRQTGAVLWRCGPHASNNEFTFLGDPRGFSHQHDVRRLANGNITLFDNGNYLTPAYSRAVEYQVDEIGRVVTQVWEYRETPDVISNFMGNVQQLENGSTFIGWGGWSVPGITELQPDATPDFELTYPGGIFSYRSFRFPWNPPLLMADSDSIDFGDVELGESATAPLTIRNASPQAMTVDCFTSSEASFSVPSAPNVTLQPGDSITVEVRFEPALAVPFAARMYVQSVGNTQLVAMPVDLQGNGVYTPSTTHPEVPRRFALRQNHPNPFNPVTSIAFDVPRRTHVNLAIFDAQGRLVDTLVDGIRDAGRHEVRWHVPQQASGVYFYRLRAGSFDESRKFVLLK